MAEQTKPTNLPASGARPAAGRPRTLQRFVTRGFAGLAILLVAIQFIPYGHNHTNPPVLAEPAWDSPQTRTLFNRVCADCHSNQTTWPWYSNVAPVSWLITHDVNDGRRALNVSEWGRARNKGDEAAKETRRGSMPPWFYMPIHPDAQLSAAEKQALIGGLVATFGNEEHARGQASAAPAH